MFIDRETERPAGALLVLSVLLFIGHVVTLATMGAGRVTIVFVLVYNSKNSLISLSAAIDLGREAIAEAAED